MQSTHPHAVQRPWIQPPAHRPEPTPSDSRGHHQTEIAGRYRPMTTHQLCLAWWLHLAGHITRRQLRIFFAAAEMAERRRYGKQERGRAPLYGLDELKALVGGRGSESASAELSADVRRLARIGLVTLSAQEITFARSAEQIAVDDLSGFWAMFEQVPHTGRTVPVPRRTLRALAAGFSRAQTAVILAKLIRSVFWQREAGAYRVDGRTKCSWIAEVFGISRRAVTDARARLIELGWLTPLETPQHFLNRWGAHDLVNVDWQPEADRSPRAVENSEARTAGEGGGSASPPADFAGGSASPCLNSPSSSTRNLKTRKLAGIRPQAPSGFSSKGFSEKRSRKPARSSSKPNLRDIQAEHLKETDDLLELHRQAVGAGLAQDCEASQLDFFAMAERARTRGHRPGALLMWLLQGDRREFITQADEDAAVERMRELRNGPCDRSQSFAGSSDFSVRAGTPAVGEGSGSGQSLTENEKAVAAILRVAQQQRREPSEVARLGKGWSKEQWEDAHLRYRYAQIQRTHTQQPSTIFGSIL